MAVLSCRQFSGGRSREGWWREGMSQGETGETSRDQIMDRERPSQPESPLGPKGCWLESGTLSSIPLAAGWRMCQSDAGQWQRDQRIQVAGGAGQRWRQWGRREVLGYERASGGRARLWVLFVPHGVCSTRTQLSWVPSHVTF